MKLKKLLPFATIASVATVSLTSLAACGGEKTEGLVINWSVADSDNWKETYSPRSQEQITGSDGTSLYFEHLVDNKRILAEDLSYSYKKDEQTQPIYGWKTIKTTIGDIDADNSRISFSIECIPAVVQKIYVHYEIIGMEYKLKHCAFPDNGDLYWTLDPQVYWVWANGGGTPSPTKALAYLKADHTWVFKKYPSANDEPIVLNYESSNEDLTAFLNSITAADQLSLSFWSYHAENWIEK